MTSKEKSVVGLVLLLVAVLVSIDLYTDRQEGMIFWHVALEASVGFLSLAGLVFIFRGAESLKKQLTQERADFARYKEESALWRLESKKYVEGLANAIDQQLSKWGLTAAEKEVAFLLLKGLSLKEIGEVRSTSEKTARVQSLAVYAKSGLSGRSELSAFFLEDLLVPVERA